MKIIHNNFRIHLTESENYALSIAEKILNEMYHNLTTEELQAFAETTGISLGDIIWGLDCLGGHCEEDE